MASMNRGVRYIRHLKALKDHVTPKKLRNLLKVETELRLKRIKLSGYPYIFFIDICNYCNLRCPLCPSALDSFKQPRGLIRFADYQEILDQITDYALEINLHNWGEPLLNPDVFKIIRYTADNNIGTNLSTNLLILKENQMEALVKSGLEYLVVSIDATSEDVYRQYRVKGDFKKAWGNLRRLIEIRRKLKSKTPLIEWQFLVFRHNEHQMLKAKREAQNLGVDLLRFSSAGLPLEEFRNYELAKKWMPSDKKYWELNPFSLKEKGFLFFSNCFYLYRSLTVNPSGGVSPCCVLYDAKYDFGNIFQQSLEEIWNNEWYLSARAIFSREDGSRRFTPCEICPIFKKPRKFRVNEKGRSEETGRQAYRAFYFRPAFVLQRIRNTLKNPQRELRAIFNGLKMMFKFFTTKLFGFSRSGYK